MTGQAGIRILLVEDSASDALLVREALGDIASFPHELVMAESLGEASAAARARVIDICLLDLGLPDSQGLDTVRRFIQDAPTVPVLILTAMEDIGTSLRALKEGAQDFLVKRFAFPDALGQRIQFALERSELIAELQKSRDSLRGLALRLESVREQERIRISREIHDELGQRMTALKMDLAWVEKRLEPRLQEMQIEALRKRLRESVDLTDSAIGSVQRLAFELRPAVLDQLGLPDALKEESRGFSQRSGIPVSLDTAVDLSLLNSDLSTTFFRVFQELLTNAMRHASANRIEVAFRQVGDELTLEVRDDGVGMGAATITSERSLGLLGISERAKAHGGEMEIDSAPGGGTCVRIRIPVRGSARVQ